MVKEIAFKIISRYLALKQRYRAEYYAFRYTGFVSLGESVSMGSGSSIFIISQHHNPVLQIKSYTSFRKFCTLTLDLAGDLQIGENNFFNNFCSINCLSQIMIGDNNLFGENVKLYDHNHIYADIDASIREQGFSKAQIVIGNNCWIGSNCVILKNVTIGDNVVIGANNLIYKSIPSNTIVKADTGYTLKMRV